MAQSFPETYAPDLKVYGPNHDHIFNKALCPCEECRLIGLQNHLQNQDLGAVSGLEPENPLQGSEIAGLVGLAVAGLLGK